MREVVALEMVGAILCRPIEEREVFAQRRTASLKSSIARILGICKTLRGRNYFDRLPDLSSFVEELEQLFSTTAWQREVLDVVDEHLRSLYAWEAHRQPERQVPKTFRLHGEECTFLGPKVAGQPPTYPTASDLHRRGIFMPIPCIHRIHVGNNPTACRGAHQIQE